MWLWAEHHGLQRRAPCFCGVAVLLAALISLACWPHPLLPCSPKFLPNVPRGDGTQQVPCGRPVSYYREASGRGWEWWGAHVRHLQFPEA